VSHLDCNAGGPISQYANNCLLASALEVLEVLEVLERGIWLFFRTPAATGIWHMAHCKYP
jgi:hypothetical protein